MSQFLLGKTTFTRNTYGREWILTAKALSQGLPKREDLYPPTTRRLYFL